MTHFIIKLFIKDYTNLSDSKVRTQYGNLASITGIVCNMLLCFIKFIFGLLLNSVAMIADAINNMSDAANSVISLIGFIISGKPADKDHPYGHARYEYLACFLVSFVIILLGLSFLKTSFLKILNPEPIKGNVTSIIILVIAILTKIWMSLFYKRIGKIINSNVLIANYIDSLNDAISTLLVMITTIISMFTDINLDGIAGCIISFIIIHSGIGILKDTVDDLIGTTPDPELISSIITKLKSYEGVKGIHDLVIHTYGPGNHFATVHVEVSSNEDILVSHDMIDNIERNFLTLLGINMVIHLDPIVTDDEETNKIKNDVTDVIDSIDKNLSIHDFRMVKGETHTNLIFDILVPADFNQQDNELINTISSEIKKINPKYNLVITIDKNYI